MSQQKSSEHYPLVLVTWVDCTTFPGWHTIKQSLELQPDEVQTVGFLFSDSDNFLCITPSMCDGDTPTTLDPMLIPKSWVVKVETLGLAASCKCEVGGEEVLCKYEENCGFCAEQVKREEVVEVQEENCWGAPDPEPLETKPGDEALHRPLTLDEHIRRGGTYQTWPLMLERKLTMQEDNSTEITEE